jgi:hypothetical protein
LASFVRGRRRPDKINNYINLTSNSVIVNDSRNFARTELDY